MAIATERSGLDFYTRAAAITKDKRGRIIFERLAAEEGEHLGTLEKRYRELIEKDPLLESRPTFLFFKGAASGLFASGADELKDGVNDQQALLIGIRCERGSPSSSSATASVRGLGRQADLPEFADEERVPRPADSRAASSSRRQRVRQPAAAVAPLIDLHPTRVRRAMHARRARGALAAGLTALSVTDHDTVAATSTAAAACEASGIEFIPGSRSPRCAAPTSMARLLHRRLVGAPTVWRAAAAGSTASAR
jgi:hypothetical protein